MNRADVVIAGAGPAGSTAAILLARAGLDVVLVDRHAFPRAKPCGDCLSPNVTRLLDRLGLLEAVLARGPAGLRGWRIFSPGGGHFETRFDEITADPSLSRALAISRDRLDGVLLEGARGAGAAILQRTRVTGLLAGGGVTATGSDGSPIEIHARLVIGADGLRSVVARRAGLVRRRIGLRKVSLTAHTSGVTADRDIGEMHVAAGLCAGLAPVGDGPDSACNLTVVADADRHGRAIAADAGAFFRSAIETMPGLRGRVSSDAAGLSSDALLASGPFDRPVRRAAAPGLALVGDAAGYFDPFTGQGINQAIEGAFVLATEAADALRRDVRAQPDLRRYARRHADAVRGPRTVQRMIEFVLSRNGLADRVIARLARRPSAARALIAATGDIAPAWSVFSPSILFAFAGPAVREVSIDDRR